ncbi:MAG: insulinase family protein [Campylobacterales bacterium]|nr:insulinase family protein [Campylobacterales bacterium]
MRTITIFIFFLGVLMADILPKHFSSTLKNGLEVVVIPMNNGSNVITTDIFYKVGSRNEVMGKSGIAHMLEHLNFKSTKNLKAGEFDEIVKSYGGINNASTGFDYTHYFIKSSSQNLDNSLKLFSELMQNLNLLDEEFQPERMVVAEERRWRTDNSPIGFMYFTMFNNAFIYHPYHWTPIGFIDDILNWKIEDIKEFHKRYYQPKNAIIVVAGDVEPELVFEHAKKYFESIPNDGDIPLVYQKEPEQNGEKRAIIKKESEVEVVAIAYKIPNFQHIDQTALSAISEILSGGKSSRLQKVLVDEKRVANQVYAYNLELIDAGVFIIMAVCNPNFKAEEVEKLILQEIKKIKKDITSEEVEKTKINAKADFIFSLENSSNVADLYGSYLARGDINPLLTHLDRLNALSAKDIQNVAKKYFKKQNSTTVILRKKSKE